MKALAEGRFTMTKAEQAEFINDLIDNCRESILSRLDDIPEDWDGAELRLFVRDKFAEVVWGDYSRGQMAKYRRQVRSKALM